ncbi:LysR family transcriptional regulator [Alteromonas sp. C1M14]|uniref:LysR family transcriptional regulator n=1 Tax=Alteromonas sp. C1M14 TaxID=2841567 RepID=UPI001C098FD3|nr:LysR family transcriptional regulator [Alteromonas sp. C1M14]MBU2979256.1 LysR family transcriptional regulator [Alteromonas sp. C1M14]
MNVEDLRIVINVAKFQSIKEAGEHLSVQTATASAAVKRVEKHFGTELFIRSTRHLRLSPAGERFLPTLEHAFNMLGNIEQEVRNQKDQIEGEIRLSVSSDFGRNKVLPWLDEFMAQHPALRVKLHISDSNIDFYRDPVDLALRYGSPKDSHLYGFKICDVPRILCASPAYLQNVGTPSALDELQHHNGLLYQLYDKVYDHWALEHQGQVTKVRMHSNRASNDAELVRRWCVAGKGIANKSLLDMSDDVLAGRVVPVMPSYSPPDSQLWLICPTRQLITPSVRLLKEFITVKCEHIFGLLKQQGYFPISR